MANTGKNTAGLSTFLKGSSKPRDASLWDFAPEDFTDFMKLREDKKFVVALSAGKLKLACHLPLLRLIEACDMKVDELWGVSAGAMVGGLWASGFNVVEIDKAIEELNIRLLFDIFNIHAMKTAIEAYRQEEMLKTAGIFPGIRIENHIRELLDDPKPALPNLNLEDFYAITYNISRFHKTALSMTSDGKIKHLDFDKDKSFSESLSNGNLADVLRASIAMPGIYWPKEIGGDLFLDGGITEHQPIHSPFVKWVEDIHLDREDRDLLIVAVEASYWDPDTPLPPNPLSIISESFEILGVELSKGHELVIDGYKSTRGSKAELIVIRPEQSYTKLTELPDFTVQIDASRKAVTETLGNK